MTNWLFEQTLLLSSLISLLLLAGPWLTQKLGPSNHYMLWFCVPISLMVNSVDFSLGLDRSAVTTFLVSAKSQADSLVPSESYVQSLVSIIWILGMSAMTAWAIISHRSSGDKTKLDQYQGVELPKKTAKLIEPDIKLGIGHENTSPYVRGLFSPELIIPANFQQLFSAEQQALIVKHELVHLRRKDILWNLLAFALLTIFWFNPLFWFAYRRFRFVQELSCDQAALKGATKSTRLQYANALLRASSHQPKLILSHLTFGEKDMLKQRITQLKSTSPSSLLGTLTTGLGIVLLGATLTVANADITQQPVQKIEPLKRVSPQYPIEAAQQEIEGSVSMSFDVDAQGNVINVQVIASSPEGVFDRNATRAMSQWKYTNTTNSTVGPNTLEMDFKLHAEDEQ